MEKIKYFIYSIVDILNRGRGFKVKINNFTLRFPTRYSRYFPDDYEVQNFAFLEATCREGSTVVDVGAHFGLFSIRAAQLTGASGKVYAFEPTPSTFLVLKKTISINQQEKVIEPVNAALSDHDGQSTFYVGDAIGDVANSLVNYNDKIHKGYPVELISCDSFVSKRNLHVDFLKIDAEGAELSVLKGAQKVLRAQKPYCILAMHPFSIKDFGDSSESIWDFLQTLPYSIAVNNSAIDKKIFCGRKDLFDVHLSPVV